MRTFKRKGYKLAWFYEECWRANIYFTWDSSPQKLIRMLKEEWDISYTKTDRFGGRALEFMKQDEPHKGVPIYVIALAEKWSDNHALVAALSHECLHITRYILNSRGLTEFNDETEEAFTYLQESLLRRCLKLLAKPRASR